MSTEQTLWLDEEHAEPMAKVEAYPHRIRLRGSEETFDNLTAADATALAEALLAAVKSCNLNS